MDEPAKVEYSRDGQFRVTLYGEPIFTGKSHSRVTYECLAADINTAIRKHVTDGYDPKLVNREGK